ncbi:MAG: sigma-70 family RNA polymerase sigma factor [Conexibacteraceae bacterium]|nr:sigma-70 family RNA polymerase sigma factor [Conexibacteraceae bacterium]
MDRRAEFEAMHADLGPAVRTFVHRRIDPAVADDVVAEVFLAAWRRFDEAPSDGLPWLLGIARGVLANQRRGDGRRAALHRRLADHAPSGEPASEALSGDSAVLRALTSLSPRDQETLLLIAWDGLDRRQAARVLGISTGQLAVRLHRARRRLQGALDEERRQPRPLRPAKTPEVL